MKPSLLTLIGVLFAPAALLAQGATEGAATAADIVKAATAEASNSADPFSLLTMLQQGGWAVLILALMSILMVALIFFYILTLRAGAIVSPHFMNTAEVLLKKKDYPALLAISNRQGEAVAQIVRRTLDFSVNHPTAPFEAVREIAQTEGSSQASALQHRITYLADIAVLAPMVGLLGTVFGIIRSFGVMGSSMVESKRFTLLSDGVSEALIATGAGLVIGIVAMAFYGLFRNRVSHLISHLERASAHLLGILATQRSEASQTEPAPASSPFRSTATPSRERREPQRRPAVSVDDEF